MREFDRSIGVRRPARRSDVGAFGVCVATAAGLFVVVVAAAWAVAVGGH